MTLNGTQGIISPAFEPDQLCGLACTVPLSELTTLHSFQEVYITKAFPLKNKKKSVLALLSFCLSPQFPLLSQSDVSTALFF